MNSVSAFTCIYVLIRGRVEEKTILADEGTPKNNLDDVEVALALSLRHIVVIYAEHETRLHERLLCFLLIFLVSGQSVQREQHL